MIIEENKIVELEARIDHIFINKTQLVCNFTDYYNCYFYIKNGSLFREHQLNRNNRPEKVSIQEHAKRLGEFRESLRQDLLGVLALTDHPHEQHSVISEYIINNLQLLARLTKKFVLIGTEDIETLKAQTLFIIEAARKDFMQNSNREAYLLWLGTHLDTYIQEAHYTGCHSAQDLSQQFYQLQNTVADYELSLNEQQSTISELAREVDILKEQVSSYAYENKDLSDRNFQLETNAQRQDMQLSRLQADLAQANVSLNELQTLTTIHSSGVRTEVVVRPNFNEAVLALASDGLHTPKTLLPLRGKIPDGEDSSEYFRQFIPYILEETRAEIDAQFKTIAKKNFQPFPINIKSTQDRTKDTVTLKCTVKSKDVPKLDHGFYREAVLVVTEEQRNRGKNNHPHAPQNSLDGFIAIASLQKNLQEEDDEKENRQLELELVFPKEDWQKLVDSRPNSLFGQLNIHWLAGLIPASRQYDVCLKMPVASFQHQFVRAELLAWPEQPPQSSSINTLPGLNTAQCEVVQRLKATEGGLFFLQGPPGTGKTTTAVRLLGQFTQSGSHERLLVCAHTNQAVRILLSRTLKLMPDVKMALIGVAKDIPDYMREVYVHKYAAYLYEALIICKRSLKKAFRHADIKIIAQDSVAQYEAIFRRLTALVESDTNHLVKYRLKESVRELQNQIMFHLNSFNVIHSVIITNSSTAVEIESAKNEMINNLDLAISSIKSNSYNLESFLVQRAQIVFSTLISSGKEWLYKQVSHFPTILLDEAAQAIVPEALIPLSFSPQTYIHIGDPCQLPATITSNTAQAGGYSNSMMHWLTKEYAQPYEMLTIQYRMKDEICRWVSQLYYENKLVTATEVNQRPSILTQNRLLSPQFKKPCLFFNIISGEEQRFGPDSSASITNQQEASAVVGVACYLILKCGIEASDIGVISFYSAQISLLNELFRQVRSDKMKELTVSTVDGFQGAEKKITLVSAVRTRESVGFLNDPRRLCVGMSRAQDGRWIFGMFSSLCRSNSDFPSLLDEHKASNNVVEEEALRRVVNIR
jgi:flagellar biosynthesis GTPase FlhF